jgi:hypothetical protein
MTEPNLPPACRETGENGQIGQSVRQERLDSSHAGEDTDRTFRIFKDPP